MSEFKGTEGEWEVIYVSNGRGGYYKVMVGNTSICNITTRDETQSKANVKVISFSLKMLKVLQKIAKKEPFEGKIDFKLSELKEIEQLIKKATEL